LPRAVILFVAAVASLPLLHFIYDGSTIFHINSIGSGSILFPKLLYERIRDLNFLPPVWTDLYGSGGPFAVGPTTFNPFIFAVSWIAPFTHALIAYEALMRGLGALGCYLLLRHNGLPVPAAMIGGGVWAFNVFSMTAGQDPQIGQSTLLLPWPIAAAQHLVERRSWRAASGLALALAAIYFASSTQVFMTVILSLVMPFVVLIYVIRCVQPSAPAGWLRRIAVPAGLLLFAGAATLALVWFDFSQQIDNLAFGARGLHPNSIIADYFALAVAMVAVVLPLYALVASPWMLTRAIGMAVVLYGFWSTLVMLRLAPGTILTANTGSTPLSEFIFDLQIPKYMFTAVPTALAVLGTWQIVRRQPRNASAILVVCIGSAFAFMPQALGRVPDYYVIRCIFVPPLGFSALAAIGAAWFVTRFEASPQRYRLAAAALLVLTTAETLNVIWRQTLFTPSIKYTRLDSPEMEYLASLGPGARVIDEYEGENTLEWAKNIPYHRRALPRWLIPAYAGVGTFSRIGISLVQNDYQEVYERGLHKTYFGSKIGEWSPVLDAAAVTHLIAHESPPEPHFIAGLKGPDYTIYENPKALPRVQLYDRVVALPNAEGLDHLVAVARNDVPFAAVVAPEDAGRIGALTPGVNGVTQVTASSGGQVTISAQLNGRGLVVLADTYHPHWRATIDGQAVPIVRANVAFRGVIVDSGAHTIEFRFSPPRHGLYLSGAAIAAIGLLAILASKRKMS
jgi:hypothetical protein